MKTDLKALCELEAFKRASEEGGAYPCYLSPHPLSSNAGFLTTWNGVQLATATVKRWPARIAARSFLTYTATDEYGRVWFGRCAGFGMITRARRKKGG